MRKRSKFDASEVIDVPKSCAVDRRGYVYLNVSSSLGRAVSDNHVFSTHDKKCIGRLADPENPELRKFVPNKYYAALLNPDARPLPPDRADSLSAGVHACIAKLADECGLYEILGEVFGSEDAQLILDLASYMVIEETAVFQHYPRWAREHVLFSESVRSDSYISGFLDDHLTIPKINQFKDLWGRRHIGSGSVYFCYDSTNVNSQAEGVSLVQKGHAKDDPDLEQVNTDYVIRQEDGLPLTFTQFPGSIVDIAEAPEMIAFVKKIGGDKKKITMICDRGYISEDNVDSFDHNGINFLLMLKSNLTVSDKLLDENASKLRSYANYMEARDEYGMMVEGSLFGDEKQRYFHFIWDGVLEKKNRLGLNTVIKSLENELKNGITRKKVFTAEELRRFEKLYRIETKKAGKVKVKAKGRGKKDQYTEVPAFRITSYKPDHEAMDKEFDKCGIYILVTSEKMAAEQAREAYAKRDCVEKTFEALKSHMGMDKYGVSTEERMHGKALIWFVASIIHSLIFNKTEKLRVKNRKDYTVPSMIDILEAIKADRNLTTGKYEMRYRMTKQQRDIASCMNVREEDVQKLIASL